MRSGPAEQMTEQVVRGLAILRREGLAQELHVRHTVHAKKAKVIPQFAPGCGGPKWRIEPEAQGTDLAARHSAVLVAVAEPNFLATANRCSQST